MLITESLNTSEHSVLAEIKDEPLLNQEAKVVEILPAENVMIMTDSLKSSPKNEVKSDFLQT